MPAMRKLFSLLLLAGPLAGISAAPPAAAHAEYRPFSTNRYAVLGATGDGLLIDYRITVGDLPAEKLRRRFDADGDGVVAPAERAELIAHIAGRIAAGLEIALDGRPQAVRPAAPDVDLVSDRVALFAPIWLRYRIAVPCAPGRHRLVYRDRTRLEQLSQTEIYIRRHPRLRLLRAGRLLRDRGVRRRLSWDEGRQPDPVLIDFALAPAGRAATGSEPAAARGAPLDEAAGLKRALLADELEPWGWLLALGLAFGLGALHALSPGHGKTLVAAYLVGSRGTVRHAVLLGGIVTATHVSSVVLLGLVALWASSAVVPERLTPWIALAAGLLVLAMGGWMLARRLRARGRAAHHHHHHDRPAAARVRWSELLLLGLSGGMVPCPSAAVVLLSAIYLGRIGLGLLLIAAFSLGLAASLVIVGVLVVRGRHLLERLAGGPRSRRLAAALPLLSALLITALGGTMTALAIVDIFL